MTTVTRKILASIVVLCLLPASCHASLKPLSKSTLSQVRARNNLTGLLAKAESSGRLKAIASEIRRVQRNRHTSEGLEQLAYESMNRTLLNPLISRAIKNAEVREILRSRVFHEILEISSEAANILSNV